MGLPTLDSPERPLFAPSALVAARVIAGVTATDLGRRIGVKRQYLQQLENGERQPNGRLLQQLAAELGVEPAFLSRPFDLNVSEKACFLRGRASTSGREWEQARYHVALFQRLAEY